MATQARGRTISHLGQRSDLVRPQSPSDTFHQALCSVELSYDSFLSAISHFIGCLYVVSQPQQDFLFVVERSTTCSQDLVLTVQHTWRRLSINERTIRSLTMDMKDAIQNLVSMVDMLDMDNDALLILASDFSLLFSKAMQLVRVASTLVSGARAVLCRLNCRQRELRPRGQASAAVNDISAPSGPQNRPRTHLRLRLPLPALPKRSASLEPRSIPSNCGTSMGIPHAQVGCSPPPSHEASPQNLFPHAESRTRATCHGLSDEHPAEHETISRPLPEACSITPIGVISHRPASSCNQARKKDNAFMTRHDLQGPSDTRRRVKSSGRVSQPGSCGTPLQKRTWPATIHKGTDGVRDWPEAKRTKRLSPIDDIKEASRRSRRVDSLSPSRLHFNDAEVTAGTLAGLVEHLTARRSASDTAFQYTFYLTFRLFCTPRELAEQLVERFHRAQNSTMAKDIQRRVCDVFRRWLEIYWRRKTDQEALPIIESFVASSMSSINPAAGRRLTQLIEQLPDQALQEFWPSPPACQAKIVAPDHSSPKTTRHRAQLSDAIKHQWGMLKKSRSSKDSSSLLSFGCLAFARQLTVKQTTLLCRIPPHELLGCEWMCKGGGTSPNIRAMVSFTNQLSNLVVETILEHRTATMRAAAVDHWINIAQRCSDLGNYDGLTALLSGLAHSAIVRLHQTWDVVSPKAAVVLEALQALIEPSHNHKSLRALLKSHDLPCLPFLGMYLTDLAFVDMAHPSTKPLDLANNHEDASEQQLLINFAKYSRTAKIVRQIERFQTPCKMTAHPRIQQWLASRVSRLRDDNDSKSDIRFFNKSLALEPRDVP